MFFDKPVHLSFKDVLFCLTGKFVSGSRQRCENAIQRFGGIPVQNITQNLNYLIVGPLVGSRDGIATGYGRKIEKAFYYKESGCPITLLSEVTLLKFMAIV